MDVMFVERILKAAESYLVPLGYEVVDIELDNRGLVRIFVDIYDGTREINLKDCELITKQLVYLFPVEGISFERLEVSSPGVDRKLTKIHHFERFIGAEVKLKFRNSIAGKKNYTGLLGKMSNTNLISTDSKKTLSLSDFRPCEHETLFYLEHMGHEGIQKIEFDVGQLEQARLVEKISMKGKAS